MELLSNLVWLTVCLIVLGTTLSGIRRGSIKLPAVSALTAAAVLCLLLLPVISMTDDLIDDHPPALPFAAQAWHLASDAASVGLEAVSLLSACLSLLIWALRSKLLPIGANEPYTHPYAAWLTRAQRLRPPPAFAL